MLTGKRRCRSVLMQRLDFPLVIGWGTSAEAENFQQEEAMRLPWAKGRGRKDKWIDPLR